jgi:hypothetical protein
MKIILAVRLLLDYSLVMSTIYLITGSSSINGRDLFLGAGRTRADALKSAYGSSSERLHRGHYLRKFDSIEAALTEFPSFESSIMCEL